MHTCFEVAKDILDVLLPSVHDKNGVLIDKKSMAALVGKKCVTGLVTVLCRSPLSLSHLGFEGERADAAQI